MKRTLLLLLLSSLMLPALGAAERDGRDSGAGVPFAQDRSREVFLDGTWAFSFSTEGEAPADWAAPACDDSGWDRIAVPGCWDALGFVRPRYTNPVRAEGWYRRHFRVPAKWLRKGHVYLRFDGVLKGYEVRVNGQAAGRWESAFNSCQFDITDFVQAGDNVLAVHVYTEYKGSDFDSNDDWGQAGINRSVSVFLVPETHIADVRLMTDRVSEDGARLAYTVPVARFGDGRRAVRARLTVRDPQGRRVRSWRAKVPAGGNAITGELALERPQLWNAEQPRLYSFECRLRGGDRQTVRFGVREVTVEGSVLKLNGRPLKLRGVNLHDTDPLLGKVISRELLLKDLEMMKQAGVNFIRCCHYPKAPEFYDLCDELGFYVMDEVPFGFGDSHLYDLSYQENLLMRAAATVARDKNHPSVIVWSIGNENPLTPIAEETGRWVKAADPTRPICYPMVHNYFLELDYNIPEFVDIYAPHYPPVATLQHYAATATRPVIVTEYCHSLGESLEQQDELWEIMQASPNIAGGAIWEWCDQGMPDRTETFPGVFAPSEKLWLRDSTCISMEGNSGTDGILYADRTPLSNYYEVRTNYAQARILTDTLRVTQGSNPVRIALENRYDFVDLADAVAFRWTLKDGLRTLDEGRFTVSCAPGARTEHPLTLELPGSPADRFYVLTVEAVSPRWGSLCDYAIPLLPPAGPAAGALFSLAWLPAAPAASASAAPAALPEMFLRAGRKRGLAEVLRARNAVAHYLLRPEWAEGRPGGRVRFRNDEFAADGAVTFTPLQGGAVRVDAEIIPRTEGKLLLEGGLAFLLPEGMDFVQWLGNGPYASYPGKMRANRYGVHALHAGDLYFEGNRMGVDMAAVTDAEGRGWMFLCRNAAMNFERTDAGVVLTVNDMVSGLCGKLRQTAFPALASPQDPLRLSFTLIPLPPGPQTPGPQPSATWPESLAVLFRHPDDVPRFQPFLTQYDTWSLPLTTILAD
ncbi:MAG: hypothetical protein J6Y27_05780 [Bacteroidales bacterium]|nr:hypothetical protein [Bacteroidales bacterium]